MQKNPDAVLVPMDWMQDISVLREIGDKLFGGKQPAYGLDAELRKQFGRPDPITNDCRKYPPGHPSAGQNRYEWLIARKIDGEYQVVMAATDYDMLDSPDLIVGFLFPDPHANTPEIRRAKNEMTRLSQDAYMKSPEYEAMMRRLFDRSEDTNDA